MSVLCLVELDGADPADVSLRALTLARTLGDSSIGPSCSLIRRACRSRRWLITASRRVRDRAGHARGVRAAGLGPGTGRAGGGNRRDRCAGGRHRPRQRGARACGAITGLPMAANCTVVTPDGGRTHRIVRHRWAGLLLEHAVMEAPVALFTVATDAVAPVPADACQGCRPGARAQAGAGRGGSGGAGRRVGRAGGSGRRGVAGHRAGRCRRRPGRGGPDGFAPLEELAELLGGMVGVSRVVTSEAGARTGSRSARPAPRSPRSYTWPAASAAPSSNIAGCAGAKHIIAINTDPGAPHPGPRRLRHHRRPAPGYPGPGRLPAGPLKAG